MGKYLIKDEPVKGNIIFRDDYIASADTDSPIEHNFIPITTTKKIGLSMEEILEYQRDPFYVFLRWLFVILIFLLILSMMIFVVIFIMHQPSCPYRPKLQFYEKEILYQVEVATFKDSNGDGIGDINGIISKLEYLRNELGVRVICLNRLISKKTPMEIDDVYGSDDDLKKLKKNLDNKDMFILIDIPASYLETNKDEEIISHWLNYYANGIRLIEGEKALETSDISKWSDIVKKVSANTFKEKYFGVVQKERMNLNTTSLTNPQMFLSEVQSLYKLDSNDNAIWPDLILGNFQSIRLSNLFEETLYKLVHSLVLLLKGTPIILAGDEIALKGRNEVENYMQWDDTNGCGFTDNVNIGYYLKNQTDCQNSVLDSVDHTSGTKSLVEIYKNLSVLRREPSFVWGNVSIIENNKIISYVREADGFDGYLVAANTGSSAVIMNFEDLHRLPNKGVLVYFYTPGDIMKPENFDEELNLDEVIISQGQFLVFRFVRS